MTSRLSGTLGKTRHRVADVDGLKIFAGAAGRDLDGVLDLGVGQVEEG